VNLDEDGEYDPSDLGAAFAKVTEHSELVIGLVYRQSKPSFEQLLPKHRFVEVEKRPTLEDVMVTAFS
jgi:2-oxoglutarate ferredoxin oxidoreductase subunit beta